MTEYMVACQTADPDDEGPVLTFMADVESPYVFASAPDLLAALERVESILRPIATDNPVYERTTAHFDAHGIARAAIAMATTEGA